MDEERYKRSKERYLGPPQETNPIVFFDIKINTTNVGRIMMELFADICPKTSENFRQLCTGEYKVDGVPQGYEGSSFHRIVPGAIIQGGDFVTHDGKGITSIYDGKPFPDENFLLSHMCCGLLSMANSGPDTNGCQFFITCGQTTYLDDEHVVFGRVISGMDIVRMIEAVPVSFTTKKLQYDVRIVRCGQI